MTSDAPATGEPVRTGTGATLASWRLRAVVAMPILLVLLTVTVAFGPPVWLLVALVAAATATVGNPRSHAATVLLGLVAMTALAADGPGWWLPILVFGLHAAHVGAAVTAAIPTRAEVELAALVPTARRFAAVQAVAQAITLLTVILTL